MMVEKVRFFVMVVAAELAHWAYTKYTILQRHMETKGDRHGK